MKTYNKTQTVKSGNNRNDYDFKKLLYGMMANNTDKLLLADEQIDIEDEAPPLFSGIKILSTAENVVTREVKSLKEDTSFKDESGRSDEFSFENDNQDFSAQIVTGATNNDLSPNQRARLRKLIESRNGDPDLLRLSNKELDKELGLVVEDRGSIYPTVTGMLLIGKEASLKKLLPSAKTSFQVLEGIQIRLNQQFIKPILESFEIFENYLKEWNQEKELTFGPFECLVPDFSEAAFREGLINAFCHRDYGALKMIHIEIEDEGLSISSPGGFIDSVNPDNLLTSEPQRRNQTLATALSRIGLSDNSARGIHRIFEGSIIYGRPLPDYSESTEDYVKLYIPRAKPDLSLACLISDEEKRTGRRLSINALLILAVLHKQRATLEELVEKIHISPARAKANLERLWESGLVEVAEIGFTRYYQGKGNDKMR